MDDFARWVSENTGPGCEILVINDGPGDDANVREIWIGDWPPQYEDMSWDEIEAERKKNGDKGR